MKTIFLVAIFLTISHATFAQKKFFNENYKLQRHEVKIAFIPLLTVDKLYTETIAESLTQDSLNKVTFADVEEVSHNILSDTLLNESVRKIIAKVFSGSELKHNPKLSQFITTEALANMKRMLDSSDILLIPSGIKTRKIEKVNGTGTTTVYGRFRLYDLNTGEFIFDYFAEPKVQYLIASTEIRKLMTLVLEDFHSYYFKNFITRNDLSAN